MKLESTTPLSAVFIVGPTASGKSALCRALAEFGFSTISASKCLRKLYIERYVSAPDRYDLAEYGKLLLDQGQLDLLHFAVSQEMIKSNYCAVDGLRFKESIEYLERTAQRFCTIFLSCPSRIRRKRFQLRANVDWAKITNHMTETAVEELRERANLQVDSSQCLGEVVEKTIEALRSWNMIPTKNNSL